MARTPRSISKSGIYHIMLRGINRQTIFEDEQDMERLLETINKYKETSKFEVYAYCIMSNHFHLLMKETEESISNSMKRIISSYVFWYNKKYERCGHLFQERFKSEVVENDEYFITVLRYIHQNPLKAGMVKNTSDYKWSSYGEYLGEAYIIDKEFALDIFSPVRQTALEQFCIFNNQKNNDMCLEDEEKVRVSDKELKVRILEFGVTDPTEIKQLEKSKRDKIVKQLKSLEGVTVRQISRITGISKSLIDKI